MSEPGKSPNAPDPANDAEGPSAPKPDTDAFRPVDEAADAPDPVAAATALADRVNELEAEVEAQKDERLRALAEAENARRRAQKDREEANRYGASALARDVIGVADDLARALDAMPAGGDGDAIATLAEGVAMVQRQLAQALERNNIKTVGAVGEQFDPNTCQAVFEVETSDVPPGAIAQVMQNGYMLHDRLLRAAMVGVAKAPADVAEAPATDAAGGERGGQVDETA